MPVIKSAIKKLRKDRKREVRNDLFRLQVEKAVTAVKKKHTKETLSEAFSLIDKAAKKHLLHSNKASRMKASLSKLLTPSQTAVKKQTV